MNISKTVIELRKSRGMTQRALAEKSGVSESALSSIETGKALPHFKTIKALSEAFEMPLGYFIALTLEAEDLPVKGGDIYGILAEPIRNLIIGRLI